MNVLIAGGTGFVGKHLTEVLKERGHHIYILTRFPDAYNDTVSMTYLNYNDEVEDLPIIHAVINLAGESLFGYWTKNKKESILSSRIEITKKVIVFLKQMKIKPSVFINGSAIGFYGTSEEIIFTEKTKQVGEGFLANVVKKWENTATEAESLGIRTIYMRFGVILGQAGALPLMRLPIKLFAGGKIGNGEQWISWIHIKDVVNLIIFGIENEQIEGVLNVTAPYPQRNKEFTKTLAKVLKRPHWFQTPSPLIRVILGEMSELITEGQYVLPQKALDHNFHFKFPHLEEALREIK